jgi:hypothetical protein
MSATLPPELDLREQITRIDRMREETLKFMSEQRKLDAEARKFDRERWAVYVAAFGGLIGGAAGIVSLLRTFGGL